MIVAQLYMDNPLANFNYLIACPQTGEALAVDPLDADRVVAEARARGWEIRQVVNTHEHGDHTQGNHGVKQATGARVLAHNRARHTIGGVDQGLEAGDVIRVGRSVELLVLDTPGHTFAHVCLRAWGDHDALFSGDTLFNAGAGNCKGGGDPATLYRTFRDQLFGLPDETLLYPGHAYARKNLQFALDREPDNAVAAGMLAEVSAREAAGTFTVTTLAQERRVNVFLRLESPSVRAALAERFPGRDLSDPQARFMALREIRDTF